MVSVVGLVEESKTDGGMGGSDTSLGERKEGGRDLACKCLYSVEDRGAEAGRRRATFEVLWGAGGSKHRLLD